MSTKLCPMPGPEKDDGTYRSPCMGEECGIWDEENEQCSTLTRNMIGFKKLVLEYKQCGKDPDKLFTG